jgi:S1-C subfamily serine protease
VIGGIYQLSIGEIVTLDILRGTAKLPVKIALRERPSTPGDLADLADRDDDMVRQIGILAVTVDEKVTSILPGLRRLYGVIVAAIPVEFAALNPGLLTGDVIYEFNGKRIKTLEMLRDALTTTKPESPVALLVEREGRLIYIAFQME